MVLLVTAAVTIISSIGYLNRRSACYQHHTKQREVVEARSDEEKEVEEFISFPIISNHRVYEDRVQNPLYDVVDDLHTCLPKSNVHNLVN